MWHQRFTLTLLFTTAIGVAKAQGDYGLDCSWPIHDTELNCGSLLGDRQAVHEEYMEGCKQKWGSRGAQRCDFNEKDRLEMSRRQPQSMVVSRIDTVLAAANSSSISDII